jgi:hypothetical protein
LDFLVSILFYSIHVIDSEGASGGNQYDVIVDGRMLSPLKVKNGVRDYVLVTGLSPGIHNLTLNKRTEASYVSTRFVPTRLSLVITPLKIV